MKKLRIRIDLKIFIFFVLFYFTKQLKIYSIVMFFCLIHELGHIIIGIMLKLKLDKIEIMPFGLSASFIGNMSDIEYKIKNGNVLELKKIIIAISGPIVNLILIMIFLYIDIFDNIRQEIIYSNVLIFIFNMMPLYPLDGGRIIKGILHIEFGKEKSYKMISKTSEIIMIIITLLSSIAVYYFKNISIFLICLYLWYIILREKNKKSLDIS